MGKPYKLYKLPSEGGGKWIRNEIVAETEAGKQQGIIEFKRLWQVYDARVEHETGTTAVVRRYYKQ